MSWNLSTITSWKVLLKSHEALSHARMYTCTNTHTHTIKISWGTSTCRSALFLYPSHFNEHTLIQEGLTDTQHGSDPHTHTHTHAHPIKISWGTRTCRSARFLSPSNFNDHSLKQEGLTDTQHASDTHSHTHTHTHTHQQISDTATVKHIHRHTHKGHATKPPPPQPESVGREVIWGCQRSTENRQLNSHVETESPFSSQLISPQATGHWEPTEIHHCVSLSSQHYLNTSLAVPPMG